MFWAQPLIDKPTIEQTVNNCCGLFVVGSTAQQPTTQKQAHNNNTDGPGMFNHTTRTIPWTFG